MEAAHVLCCIPRPDLTEVFLGASGQLEVELKAKDPIDVLHEVEQARHLRLHLRRHAENVRVVLHESTHARQAGERTGGFVSDEGRRLAGCESLRG